MLKLSQWGEVLTGRRLGRQIRELALQNSLEHEVIMDFSGVEVASHSFCDEVFGILMLELENPTSRIKAINASDTIKATIKYVMLQRLQEKQKMVVV
jgi:hypothetical protein